MNNFTLADVLLYINPNAVFSCGIGIDDDILWLDNSFDEPSREEIYAAWDEYETLYWFAELRKKRNLLLSECDWTQLNDANVDKAKWASYRQALRDLPENTIDCKSPIWPINPSERGINGY